MTKLIEGGELRPDCNFEVDWCNYDANSLKNEESLFDILKEFLQNKCENPGDTYPMFDLEVANKEGEQFEKKYINKGLLIPHPTKKQPFQLIREHTLEDAFYALRYIDKKSPLSIEYQTYDNQKFLVSIIQKGKNCEYDFQGDGGTQDYSLTLRVLNNKGKIQSFRSKDFANLPLELTEDSEDEHIKNLKKVSKNFLKKIRE